MSDDDAREPSRTQTRTRADEETSEEGDKELLTPEEERVVRARHGLSEDDDHELSFAVGADEETEAKIARLEQFLLQAFSEREEGENYFPESVDALEEGGTKQKIVEALREHQPD